VDIILIPGLWLDGSTWDDLVPVLMQSGHRPHPVTLPGMQSKDADRSGITLRDHVDAVVAVIDSLDGPVVLAGHSGGGAIAHAAADARPDRVGRVIYVDSIPLADGGVINDELPAEDGEVPLPEWSFFDEEDLVGLDDRLRAQFRERAIPAPIGVSREPQRLSDDRRYDIPVTVIACAYPSATLREWIAADQPYTRELGRIRSVDYVDLPTGHWPQFTRPGDLGRAIATAAGQGSAVR
jgi:pimeloyl-ACP methyl ester carboxylesterase